MRQIYNAVVRPAMTYGAAVWYSPSPVAGSPGRKHKAKGPVAKLISTQNKCLRAVAGAYRATPISVLEMETHTPPLDLFLDAKLAKFRLRHKQSGMEVLVSMACARIRSKLQRRRTPSPTTGQRRSWWVDAWLRQGRTQAGQQSSSAKQVLLQTWRQRWDAKRPEWGLIRVGPPREGTIKIYAGLHKAESAVMTQIRTGRIGLTAFLNKARVPDFPSPVCQCGRARETAQHIIVHCDRSTAARNKLADPRTGGVNLKSLLSSAAGAQCLAKWFI